MSKTLTEIAQQLKDANKKVQLIYAFNGTGKTRLSREFKRLITTVIDGKNVGEEADQLELTRNKILYYNAFTEDLFYWDNGLDEGVEPVLRIHPNAFTEWVLKDQGQDQHIVTNFQRYTNKKLTPYFISDSISIDRSGRPVPVKEFSEVVFRLSARDDSHLEHLKISKGEESCFIWSIFYTLIDQVINVLNVPEPNERESNDFDELEYVFIDDPVSSLDENHLIQLAVDLAQLIKSSQSELKFILTTHSPLFYNVLYNELHRNDPIFKYKKNGFASYRLDRLDDGSYLLAKSSTDSPFSYHLYLKYELEKASETGQLKKYHFNLVRNFLEKTSTFLGYEKWGALLENPDNEKINPLEARIINISSHSKHSGEEYVDLTEDDKRILQRLIRDLGERDYRFNPQTILKNQG